VRVADDRPPACPAVPPRCSAWRLRSLTTAPTCGREGHGDTVVAVPVSPRLPWRAVALSTILALAAATATYVLLSDDAGTTAQDPPPATIVLTPEDEIPSPDEATFVTFDDQEVPLSNLQGRPTVVNFFSSTCTPCITEMPAFEDVYQELGGEQLAFLGLAVADRAEDAVALVEQTGVTYPTAQDPDSSVFDALGAVVLPTTVLLDADGEIVASRNGELDADELRAFLADELGIRS
jgi:thiol-disulfide isomerase/thioredoxin